MKQNDVLQLIQLVANEAKIDPVFFQAICTVESSLDPFAMRYEPAWRYFYFPKEIAGRLNITEETEKQLQKFSYGLAQIMGAVAREHGYQGPLAGLMADPALCLRLSAKHLKKFLVQYGGQESEAAAAYNAGAARKTKGGMFINQQYVDKVDRELRKLRVLV